MKFQPLFLLIFLLSFGRVNAQNVDTHLLEGINGPVSGADGTWRFLSNHANYIDLAVPVTMLTVGIAEHDQNIKQKAYATFGAFFFTTAETFALKDIVRRQRPFAAHPNEITFKGSSMPTDYSFPSGHTSMAFATATSLSLAIPKWYVIAPSFLYAGAVGYSRMYLGVHYPGDVLTGAVIGAGTSWLTFKAQRWLNRRSTSRLNSY